MIALDAGVYETAATTTGVCAVPFFSSAASANDDEDVIPALTGLTKFWTSERLLRSGVAHVFSEMDVFHFSDVFHVLQSRGWDSPRRAPALLAQRARRSLQTNIGFYAAQRRGPRGDDVVRFFRLVRDAWRDQLLETGGGDGNVKAVDQTVFNVLADRGAKPDCVRRWGAGTRDMLLTLKEKHIKRNCTDDEDPLLSTFATEVVTAGSDMHPSTVVWHIHRPNKTDLMRQLFSETYVACCRAKLDAQTNHSKGIPRIKYIKNPACRDTGIRDPDDRICDRLDPTWLPAMIQLGHVPRFRTQAGTGTPARRRRP